MVSAPINAPDFTESDAESFAETLYDIEARAKRLPSDRDQNFLLTAADGRRFVLKISNPADKRELLDLQNKAMAHVARHVREYSFPKVYAGREARLHLGHAAHTRDARDR